MEVRLLKDDDYDKLVGWWRWSRFPVPAREILPEMGTGGLMVMCDGIDVCAGFIYFTNSKLVWLEFLVGNYEYRESNRKEAIVYLIESLCYLAKSKGYLGAFTSLKHSGLINHYEKAGFVKGSSNTTEMTLLF